MMNNEKEKDAIDTSKLDEILPKYDSLKLNSINLAQNYVSAFNTGMNIYQCVNQLQGYIEWVVKAVNDVVKSWNVQVGESIDQSKAIVRETTTEQFNTEWTNKQPELIEQVNTLTTNQFNEDWGVLENRINTTLENQNTNIENIQNEQNELETNTNNNINAQNTKINSIQTQQTNLANQQTNLANEQTTLSNRMDTFTSLSAGSTTGDAELQDIRVGANGVTYNNAGDAVRGQYSQLKEDLDNVSNESSQIILNNIYTNNIYISNWKSGGISSESGSETYNTGAVRSDFAKVLSGSYMYIEEVGYTNVVCICYWYNNDKNYIGSSSAVTNSDANVSRVSNVIKVPDDAMYVRYVVADWSSTIKEPSFADNMVFGTMMKNLDKKDIVGNEVLNGTIKSDGYIRKVAVNIIDYSMKIKDYQLYKDDNGLLQASKNEGWAYYRDLNLHAGHSYVFVSSDGGIIPRVRVCYNNAIDGFTCIENNENVIEKVITIPETALGLSNVDFWYKNNKEIGIIDLEDYLGGFIPYNNEIRVSDIYGHYKTFQININTEFPIMFDVYENVTKLETNEYTKVCIDIIQNKDYFKFTNSSNIDELSHSLSIGSDVKVTSSEILKNNLTVNTDNFRMFGNKSAKIIGVGNTISFTNSSFSVGICESISGNKMIMNDTSNINIGDTIAIGNTSRLIAKVVNIDGNNLTLSNGADYTIDDMNVKVIPKTDVIIENLVFDNIRLSFENMNGCVIRNCKFVNNAQLDIIGTNYKILDNEFSESNGITVWSTTNSLISGNNLVDSTKGIRCVYVDGIIITNNIIERCTSDLYSVGIEVAVDAISYSINKTMACNCIISNNIIRRANVGRAGSGIGGIHLNMGAHHNSIIGNICEYNSFGIYLENGACFNKIEGNNCSYQEGYYGVGIEIDWDGHHNIITGNHCNYNIGSVTANESCGIEIRADVSSEHVDTNNVISNNICIGNGKAGIMVTGLGLIITGNETDHNGIGLYDQEAGIFICGGSENVIITNNLINDGFSSGENTVTNLVYENNIELSRN